MLIYPFGAGVVGPGGKNDVSRPPLSSGDVSSTHRSHRLDQHNRQSQRSLVMATAATQSFGITVPLNIVEAA